MNMNSKLCRVLLEEVVNLCIFSLGGKKKKKKRIPNRGIPRGPCDITSL